MESKLSQEELAEKIFVTRQTISNWENERNYPDINSLVLLSTLFGISLDILVKGDIEEMKGMIKEEDVRKLNRDSWIFFGLMAASVVTIAPLYLYLKTIGLVLWVILYGAAMFYAMRLEKQKKAHDIQTYKEILAFTEGKRLDEIEKSREAGKRPYQTVLYAIAAGLITAVVAGGMFLWLKG